MGCLFMPGACALDMDLSRDLFAVSASRAGRRASGAVPAVPGRERSLCAGDLAGTAVWRASCRAGLERALFGGCAPAAGGMTWPGGVWAGCRTLAGVPAISGWEAERVVAVVVTELDSAVLRWVERLSVLCVCCPLPGLAGGAAAAPAETAGRWERSRPVTFVERAACPP